MWCRRDGEGTDVKVLVGLAVVVLLALGVEPATGAPPEGKYRLKPGAKGKVCLGCHVDLEEKLALPSVHTPVKAGECTDCHSPHASSHGKLLTTEPDRICLTCHGETVPKDARSVHGPAAEGQCARCHDPHAAKNRSNLLTAGNELCLGCHEDLAQAMAASSFKHPPAERSCLGCHDPHASKGASSLLAKAETALCTSCHKPDQPAFGKAHMGYPVAKGRCTSCHDPHGSSQRGMLWASAHPPVTNRMCGQCHPEPSSPEALGTKKKGLDLCRSCHADLVNGTLAARRVHWPVLDREGCLNCHGPHATREKRLLREPVKALCGGCHADTIRRQERSPTKHPPIEAGECATCHAPHASEAVFLLAKPNLFEVCGGCHDWKSHSSHPIGEKVADPRNRNLTLDCESCHRTHGTPHEHLTHFDARADLCVHCHEQYRR